MSHRLTIIGYHNVEASPSAPYAGREGVVGFERQLDVLRRVANVVPLGDALRLLYDGRRLPGRAVALTFDDGYRDALDVVAPLLRGYDLPATFFLMPGVASRGCSAWWERVGWAFEHATSPTLRWCGRTIRTADVKQRATQLDAVLCRLKRLNEADRDTAVEALIADLAPDAEPSYDDLFLDWDGCRSLSALGFEIGSHSSVHAILAREDPERQREDLAWSKKVLEDELDRPIDLLAYPNGQRGDFSGETIAAARDAGYAYAVTTIHGITSARTNPYELRRVVIDPERGVSGLFKGMAQLASAPWRHKPMETDK